MNQPIRILIADDHAMVRQGLSQICEAEPDIRVVGQAADGQEACRLVLEVQPDVVIMDINMPGLDGVQATRCLTETSPDLGVIILTMYRQDEYIFEAIKAGARAYLLKDADSEELLQAIRTVATGEALLNPAVARKMIEEFRRLQHDPDNVQGITPLTELELDILRLAACRRERFCLQKYTTYLYYWAKFEANHPILTQKTHINRVTDFLSDRLLVAQGLSNSEIGDRLSLAEKTVRNRLSLIFDKLHVNNRVQATLYALREGLANLNEEDS